MTKLTLDNIELSFPFIKQKKKINFEDKKSLKVNIGLKNISLKFKPGDRIGLIGENGAGKTVLLKTIAGIYEADKGSINIEGKLLAIFSLNAGIEDEFTGYQNIFYQMFLRGYNKEFAETKVDEIVKL